MAGAESGLQYRVPTLHHSLMPPRVCSKKTLEAEVELGPGTLIEDVWITTGVSAARSNILPEISHFVVSKLSVFCNRKLSKPR